MLSGDSGSCPGEPGQWRGIVQAESVWEREERKKNEGIRKTEDLYRTV